MFSIFIYSSGDKIRDLKAAKAAKDALQPEIERLLKLKLDYKEATGKEWESEAARGDSKPKAAKPDQKAPKSDQKAQKSDQKAAKSEEAKKSTQNKPEEGTRCCLSKFYTFSIQFS